MREAPERKHNNRNKEMFGDGGSFDYYGEFGIIDFFFGTMTKDKLLESFQVEYSGFEDDMQKIQLLLDEKEQYIIRTIVSEQGEEPHRILCLIVSMAWSFSQYYRETHTGWISVSDSDRRIGLVFGNVLYRFSGSILVGMNSRRSQILTW